MRLRRGWKRVSYPPDHPFSDPRVRAEAGIVVKESILGTTFAARTKEQRYREKAIDIVCFMWAVEGIEVPLADAMDMVSEEMRGEPPRDDSGRFTTRWVDG